MCVHAKGDTHNTNYLGELIDKLDEKIYLSDPPIYNRQYYEAVSIAALPKGGSLLELTSGTSLKVSRNYRESVRSFFQ